MRVSEERRGLDLEQASAQIDVLIERRSKERARANDLEEFWRESERKHREKRWRENRAFGKREAERRVHKDVSRVIELARKGFSPSTISTVVDVPVWLIEETLRLSSEVEEAELAEEGGGGVR